MRPQGVSHELDLLMQGAQCLCRNVLVRAPDEGTEEEEAQPENLLRSVFQPQKVISIFEVILKYPPKFPVKQVCKGHFQGHLRISRVIVTIGDFFLKITSKILQA